MGQISIKENKTTFRKTINLNKIELEQTLNIRVDDAFRLYTVLNIPEEFIGEAYDLKKNQTSIEYLRVILESIHLNYQVLNQKDFQNYTHFMNLKK
jgi:hypothetical protein